jgi:hypothetical protein
VEPAVAGRRGRSSTLSVSGSRSPAAIATPYINDKQEIFVLCAFPCINSPLHGGRADSRGSECPPVKPASECIAQVGPARALDPYPSRLVGRHGCGRGGLSDGGSRGRRRRRSRWCRERKGDEGAGRVATGAGRRSDRPRRGPTPARAGARRNARARLGGTSALTKSGVEVGVTAARTRQR